MVRKILLWPNETLNKVSEPVADIQAPEIQELVKDMIETMRAHDGAGLAAIQVGVPLRIFVMERAGNKTAKPHVCINPVVQDRANQKLGDEKAMVMEGCLSLPGFYELTERYDEVIVDYEYATEEAKISGRYLMQGLEAQCVQHEMEHLDGKLFTGPIGPVKKDIIKRKIAKALRARR